MNDHYRRLAVRAAARIHQHLLRPVQLAGLPPLPQQQWQNVLQLADRLKIVTSRSWNAAASSVQADLHCQLRQLQYRLQELAGELPPVRPARNVSAPREIAADLKALAGEFEEAHIDLQENTISVLTEPVTLENLHLGPFCIELFWERIGQSRPYLVIAQEPNRPSQDEEITHPHIRKDILCEGEGAVSIKAALLDGRLFDFFILVQQVLFTYNDASPYVAIDRWNGATCIDCGNEQGEDYSICERCDRALCSECACCCSGCDKYVCEGCRSECEACGDLFCRACLTESDRGHICKSCLENGDESHDDGDQMPAENEAESAPGPEADGVCLGQAPVPAGPG